MAEVLGGPILIGVDADGHSDAAVRAALELGRSFDVDVEFLHAVPPLRWYGKPSAADELTQGRLQAARSAVGGHLDALPVAAEGLPLSARLEVHPGKPAQVLLERADEADAGLIVLGPHERRGRIDFGSTARAVLSHASCPVWVQVDAYRPVARLLVAVDPYDDHQEALSLAAGLAHRWGAPLTLVHAFQPPDFAYPIHPGPTTPTYVVDDQRRLAEEELRAFVERHALAGHELGGLETEVVFQDGDPAETVLGMQQPDDLIVIGTHGRSGFAAAVLGSVAYGVLSRAQGPVLAVRYRG